jgi:hypothetical protein
MRILRSRAALGLIAATLLCASAATASAATGTTTATTTISDTAAGDTATSDTAAGAYRSGLPWSSGAFTDHNAKQATAFAQWRGRPLDNISVYPARQSWAALNDAWYLTSSTIPAGFAGDIVAGVPLWPQNSSVGVNANGQWRTFARQLSAKDPDAYVRLGWEMNIRQYWQVNSVNRAQWVNAFKRAVTAMHSVAPQLRIVWNPNWGGDQSDVDSRQVFQQLKDYVSVYGIDMYDAYPADLNDSSAIFRWYGYRAMADSYNYATANGKKFALPEWGVACTTGGCQWQGNAGGDNPRYIGETLLFLKFTSANVAFDSYFNEPASYLKSALYPTATNPKAGQTYIAALTQYARAS